MNQNITSWKKDMLFIIIITILCLLSLDFETRKREAI